jgi:hypothetical protein
MEHALIAKVDILRSSHDSRERRIALEMLEPVLSKLTQTETDLLFPLLQKYVGFSEWIQEAFSHHNRMRELIQIARRTADHERILDLTDELGAAIHGYLERREKILYPRIIQALNRSQLNELRLKLGGNWMFGRRHVDEESAAA